jgi:hypothetical protein
VKISRYTLAIVFYVVLHGSAGSQTIKNEADNAELQKMAYQYATGFIHSIGKHLPKNYAGRGRTKVDTILINNQRNEIHLYLNKFVSEAPLRPKIVDDLHKAFLSALPAQFSSFQVRIYSDKTELRDYIPNYYRDTNFSPDSLRMVPKGKKIPARKNMVTGLKPYTITNGLINSNIALWASHGWYYESALDRWEWQRARLFTTVEDLHPTAYVLPFLMPMLRNAGAFVISPREEDIQSNELIIDNDDENFKRVVHCPGFLKKSEKHTGFAWIPVIKESDNPFRKGTFLWGTAKKKDSVCWTPHIPDNGEYMVYISFAKVDGASVTKYRVYDTGGFQDYLVDQSMGAGTWIPLGKHTFRKGINPKAGKLVLFAEQGQTVSLDAVKFGGGMGNVSRNGRQSGKPRYMEGPRYFLQYAGFPDSLVWRAGAENRDYIDNFRCQGDWVNYLSANHSGMQNEPRPGLGIPVDLSFSFHTDAGILPNDSTVGTLAIYSTTKDSGYFANGQSRMVSRDLSDIIQTQLVDDIRANHFAKWSRRGLWNANYSEAFKPDVPAMLLELFSHQNPTEVKFGLDPHFRFTVSRAIYKGMLKFIAFQHGYDYVVQPLPVNHLKIEKIDENKARLTWEPVADPLEPTANAIHYMVYTRIGDAGFDKGTLVKTNEIVIDQIKKNTLYSFKVSALNNGGESFPSEILSLGFSEENKGLVLIVNGFDRVSGPEFVISEKVTGVMRDLDNGVPYLYDFQTTGNQYDFDPKSPWLDDDSPGMGASYADIEGLVFLGNTFDFPSVHGNSILNNGYSFISASDEAFIKPGSNHSGFDMIDYIMGEEKTKSEDKGKPNPRFQIYTDDFIASIENLVKAKIPVFISGSYIGTEIGKDTSLIKQIGELLGYKHRTNHAVRNGLFYLADGPENQQKPYSFETSHNKNIYPAEAPDAIEPYNNKCNVYIRYSENNTSAGVHKSEGNRVIALGFPFECITGKENRDAFMKKILENLIRK